MACVPHDHHVVAIGVSNVEDRMIDDRADTRQEAALPKPANSSRTVGGSRQPIPLGRQVFEDDAPAVPQFDQLQRRSRERLRQLGQRPTTVNPRKVERVYDEPPVPDDLHGGQVITT
jgi:hypothetical protein